MLSKFARSFGGLCVVVVIQCYLNVMSWLHTCSAAAT